MLDPPGDAELSWGGSLWGQKNSLKASGVERPCETDFSDGSPVSVESVNSLCRNKRELQDLEGLQDKSRSSRTGQGPPGASPG